MKISDLQRQIKYNSKTIVDLEYHIELYKYAIKHCEENCGDRTYCSYLMGKAKSKIKRLAALQKALKKEIADAVQYSRSCQ